MILDEIWRLSSDLGRGVTLDEIRGSFKERGDSIPTVLPAKVSSLKRRGVVVPAGGRPSHTLYALPGSAFAPTEGADDAVLILEAVRKGWKVLRRPLSTREVTAYARELGSPVPDEHPNAVRKRLETLATSSQVRSKGRSIGRIREVKRPNHTGRSESFWLPARARWVDKVPPPATDVDRIRNAVARCTKDLGFPVSRRDLVGWIEKLPAGDPLQDLHPSRRRFGGFATSVKSDTASLAAEGALHAIPTGFTCRGGCDLRAVVGAPTPLQISAVRALDMLVGLRANDELRGIFALEQRIASEAQDALLDLLDARKATLYAAVQGALGDEEAGDVVVLLDGYLSKAKDLPEPRRRKKHFARVGPVDLDQGHALEAALALGVVGMAPTARAGSDGLTSLEELEIFDAAYRQELGIDPDELRWVVPRARRFPNPNAPTNVPQQKGPESSVFTLIDRVDALVELVQGAGGPRAQALVRDAVVLLGHVVRDPTLLENALRSSEGLRPREARGLLVALGMLGTPPMLVDVGGRDADEEDLAAWVLAVVFAQPDTAADAVLDVADELEGHHGTLLTSAYDRILRGLLLKAAG